MDFRFGMPVVDSGGEEAGVLDHVLITARTREITHVVVRSPHVSEDVLLPLSLVQGNAGDRLVLHAAAAQLENMPRYYEGRTSSSPAGRVDTSVVRETAEQRQALEGALSVQADALQYGADTSARTSDQAVARLVGIAADQYTNRVSELRLSGLRDTELIVPEHVIGDLEADTIELSASSADLERLVGSPAGAYVHRTTGEPAPQVEQDG